MPYIQIPADLARNALIMRGADGQAWLEQLPGIIATCAEQWSLTLGAPFEEVTLNYLVPGVRADGSRVVLKVRMPSAEFDAEAAALRLFDGRSAVRLLAVDEERKAMLLERLMPGTLLSTVDDEQKATHIASQVMLRLRRPAPAQHAFQTFDEWSQHMANESPRLVAPRHPSLDLWIRRVLAMQHELTTSPAIHVLLHGDLHYDNILAAEREPWLAIDPFGLVGEAACETGPLLINRLPSPPDVSELRKVLGGRVAQLGEELGLDRARIAAWGVVRAILAAFWSVEDNGDGWPECLAVAEALTALCS